MFAVEDIDPRIGRLEVEYTTWNWTDGKKSTRIKMVPCNDPNYVSNNSAFSVENILKGRKDNKFLCPDELESLKIQGNYGAENFNYASITLLGCDASELAESAQECATDEEISEKSFNFAMLSPIPNILGENKEDLLAYQLDLTHFIYLDPTHTQETNIFFMESTISLMDSIADIFKLTEREVPIFEHSWSQKLTKWISP